MTVFEIVLRFNQTSTFFLLLIRIDAKIVIVLLARCFSDKILNKKLNALKK